MNLVFDGIIYIFVSNLMENIFKMMKICLIYFMIKMIMSCFNDLVSQKVNFLNIEAVQFTLQLQPIIQLN
jgi:hypothetical protein